MIFRAFIVFALLGNGVFGVTREIEVWGDLSCLNKDHKLISIKQATSYLMEKDLGHFPDLHDTIRSNEVVKGYFSLYGWEAEVFGVTEFYLHFTLPCPASSECADTELIKKCRDSSSVDYTFVMEQTEGKREDIVQYQMNCSIGHRDSAGDVHSGLWCNGGICPGWCNLPL